MESRTIECIEQDLKSYVFSFLMPIQTEPNLDEVGFERILSTTKELAHALKGIEYVPKSLLDEVYGTILIMIGEMAYRKHDREILQSMIDRLESCFSAILRDEEAPD